jgi:hypothetical protein
MVERMQRHRRVLITFLIKAFMDSTTKQIDKRILIM